MGITGCAAGIIPDTPTVKNWLNSAAEAAESRKDCLSRNVGSSAYALGAGFMALISAAVGYPLQAIANLAKNLVNFEFIQALKDLFSDLFGIARSLIVVVATVFNAVIGLACPNIHKNLRTNSAGS